VPQAIAHRHRCGLSVLPEVVEQAIYQQFSPDQLATVRFSAARPIYEQGQVKGYSVPCRQTDYGRVRELVVLPADGGWTGMFREISGDRQAGHFTGSLRFEDAARRVQQLDIVNNAVRRQQVSPASDTPTGGDRDITTLQINSGHGAQVPGVVHLNGTAYFLLVPSGGGSSPAPASVVYYITADHPGDAGSGGSVPGGVGLSMVGVNFTLLDDALHLDEAEEQWLGQHPDDAAQVYQLLIGDMFSHMPAALTAPAVVASQLTIAAAMQGQMSGPYTAAWRQKVTQVLAAQGLPVMSDAFLSRLVLNMILLKEENLDWGYWKIYWTAVKETTQEFLDLVGLVPVVGEIADVANGIIYTIDGDGLNATLSFAAVIPVGGWFATGARIAKRLHTAVNGTRTMLKWRKTISGAIDFGNPRQLRRTMGLPAGSGTHAHHILPWQHSSHPLIQRAAQGDNPFHMNDFENGIELLTDVHLGSHQGYSTKVWERLRQDWGNGGLTPEEAKAKLTNIINEIRNVIINNPNVNVNDLVF
jgi:hypothetical protein